MGPPSLFTRQRALKMGYFSGCALKLRITLIQSEVLVTLKDTTVPAILKAKLHLLT